MFSHEQNEDFCCSAGASLRKWPNKQKEAKIPFYMSQLLSSHIQNSSSSLLHYTTSDQVCLLTWGVGGAVQA